MEQIISKLQLMSGTDIALIPTVIVRHPTLSEVLSINGGIACEDYYWAYVSSLLCDPYDHMVYLDDMGLDYEKVTPFQVFCYRWIDAQKAAISDGNTAAMMLIKAALEMFFGPHDYDLDNVQGTSVLLDRKNPSWFMTDEMFSVAASFITSLNCIERTDKIKPANASAKMVLIEDARSEMKKRARKKDKEDKRMNLLADALAMVLAKGSGAITPSNYGDVHVYQLLVSSRAIQKQMVVQSMLNGIYSGTVKTDNLSEEELRWV